MRPSTIWERLLGWFGCLPLRFAYRVIWLTAVLGGKTAREVQRAMWDAGFAVPCPPDRDPNEMWVPR